MGGVSCAKKDENPESSFIPRGVPLFIRKFKRQHRATARYPFRDQSPQMPSVRAIIEEPVTNKIDEPVKLIIREIRRIRHERINAIQYRLNWSQWAYY